MGGGRFNFQAYNAQAAEAQTRIDSGFNAESMCDEFNPLKVTNLRYSKISPFNGYRDPITVLIGLDVTGSMGDIPRDLLKGKLGSLMTDFKKTFNRPNENIQISFAGIGDVKNDDAPLQVTHFESDNRFVDQLKKIWLEGHGGGNGAESYNVLWWYAANKTRLNYVGEGRKGILITIGDDNVHPNLTAGEIRKHLDKEYDGVDISNKILLEATREQYVVYHIVITDGQAYIHDTVTEKPKKANQQEAEFKQWTDLLGVENVIRAKSNEVAEAIAALVKKHRPVQKAGMANLSDEAWDRKTKETLSDERWIEVLSYALCPLSGRFMKQPGDWSGGKRAFEKEYVVNYVREHQEDPLTHKKLALDRLDFKLNTNIAQLCSDYRHYFDALPPDRRERLVQLALAQINSAKSASSSIASGSAHPERNVQDASNAAQCKNLGIFTHKPAAAQRPSSAPALNKDSDGIPFLFQDPIDHDLLEDPVMAEDGTVYSRKVIERIFAGRSRIISPIKNIEIGNKLISADGIRSEVLQWKEDQAKMVAEVAALAQHPPSTK